MTETTQDLKTQHLREGWNRGSALRRAEGSAGPQSGPRKAATPDGLGLQAQRGSSPEPPVSPTGQRVTRREGCACPRLLLRVCLLQQERPENGEDDHTQWGRSQRWTRSTRSCILYELPPDPAESHPERTRALGRWRRRDDVKLWERSAGSQPAAWYAPSSEGKEVRGARGGLEAAWHTGHSEGCGMEQPPSRLRHQ